MSEMKIIGEMETSVDGLSKLEAKRRLETFGPNEIARKKRFSAVKMFLTQFQNVFMILLVIASVISFVTGGLTDGIVILSIVVLNAFVGFIQEYKSEKALEALMNILAPTAQVMREGEIITVEARELVPGDIIILEEGNRIPADCHVIEAMNLKADESALTGESVPKEKSAAIDVKEKSHLLFMGTNVVYGRGKGVIVKTGMKTNFGSIADLTLHTPREASPLQKELQIIGKQIGKFAVIIAIMVFLLGIYRGNTIFEMFLYAISISVAVVPEGLPTTLTVALAMGVRDMAKRNAIVKRNSAVEALGSATVICTDKTGTLTKNEMTVRQIHIFGKTIEVHGIGYNLEGTFTVHGSPYKSAVLEQMLKIGVLCNNADFKKEGTIRGDPTEAALLVSALKYGIDRKKTEESYPRVWEFPFDSTRRRMSTIHLSGQKKYLVTVKGAAEEILNLCTKIQTEKGIEPLTKKHKDTLLKTNGLMALDALRILGFAYKEIPVNPQLLKSQARAQVETDFIFVGMQGMIDPPREGVFEAVDSCKKAGIRIFIVSGDYGVTTKAIAQEIGIATPETRVVTGEEMESLNDEMLQKILEGSAIFSRMNPDHKFRVVSLLQKMGERVAVTGDGINDAPALKKADIGVAMGITGTDVSKEASDIVLTDDSFATIVKAISEGRRIYENIKKFVLYAFSGIGAELLVILYAIIFELPLPITALQILIIDLGAEILPALALGIDPPEGDVMERKAVRRRKRLLNASMFARIVENSIIISLGAFFLFAWKLKTDDLIHAQTIAFAAIIIYQMINAFNCRSEDKSIFSLGFFSNLPLIGAVASSLVLVGIIIYVPIFQGPFHTTPLSLQEVLVLFGFALSIIGYVELKKGLLDLWNKRKKRNGASVPN